MRIQCLIPLDVGRGGIESDFDGQRLAAAKLRFQILAFDFRSLDVWINEDGRWRPVFNQLTPVE